MKYSNVFLINFEKNENVQKLTIRQSIFVHKNEWFCKVINVCVVVFVVITTIEIIIFIDNFTNIVLIIFKTLTITSISWKFFVNAKILEKLKSIVIQLFNKIIIYDFNKKIVNTFQQIVKKFSILWIDINFVEMSKVDWMKILLKNDWKSFILNKIKIYSLSIHDRRLINEIFDHFHDFDKLSWTMNSTWFSYSIFCVWKTFFFNEKKKVIVNIRDLNVIIKSNVYLILMQINVVLVILNYFYIIVVNCVIFLSMTCLFVYSK